MPTMDELIQGAQIGTPPFENGEEEAIGRKASRRPEFYQPFKGWEKKLATKAKDRWYDPALFAMGVVGGISSMELPILEHTMLSAQRQTFLSMSKAEQTKAILWDGLEVLLMATGPAALKKGIAWTGNTKIGRRAVEGIEELYRKAKPKPKILKKGSSGLEGYEKSFNYEESLQKVLKREKFAADEAGAISEVLQGGGSEKILNDVLMDRKLIGKDPTGAFRKATEFEAKRLYPRLTLKGEFAKSKTPTALREKFYQNRLREGMRKARVVGKGEGISATWVDGVFKKQAERYFGEEGLTMKLGEVSEEVVSTFIADMVTHPKRAKLLSGSLYPSFLQPQRVKFGIGERYLGTKTMVFDPAEQAIYAGRKKNFDLTMKWHEMLDEEGFYKAFKLTADNKIVTKAVEGYTSEVVEKGGKVIQYLDDFSEKLRKLDPTKHGDEMDQLRRMQQGLIDRTFKYQTLDPTKHAELSEQIYTAKFVKTWERFTDYLYADRTPWKVQDLFYRSPLSLTARGRRGIDAIVQNDIAPEMERLLLHPVKGRIYPQGKRPMGDVLTYAEKHKGVKDMLERVRKPLSGAEDTHSWFTQVGNKFDKGMAALEKDLTLGKDGNWMDLLEHYAARIGDKEQLSMGRWGTSLMGQKSFYTKSRKGFTTSDLDFEHMFAARIGSQSKEMYVYGVFDDIVRSAKSLPEGWRRNTEHLLARSLNYPSNLDSTIAEGLNNTLGRWGGKQWDGRRVLDAAQKINDFTYMAALGFKPFSAMRNMFQPLINVPADLGGLRSFEHLTKAYGQLLNPKTGRKLVRELKDIGVITEYAPEILAMPKVLPFKTTKLKFRGKDYKVFRREEVRDFALWMFKQSDRWNRYVTGAAALNKWRSAEHLLSKGDDFVSFTRKSGVKGRNPWVKDKLDDLLRSGHYTEARNMFVRDVVADTQYLYGALQSPTITGIGAPGRIGGIFQSWWMNYGSMLDKFFRTGDISTKAGRALNFYFSAAIATEMMEPLWGPPTARRTTGVGPFPTKMPWHPMFNLVKGTFQNISTAANFLQGNPSNADVKRARALVNSPVRTVGETVVNYGSIVVPGGVQWRQMYKASQKYGPEGLLASIIKFHLPTLDQKEWEPATLPGKAAKGGFGLLKR